MLLLVLSTITLLLLFYLIYISTKNLNYWQEKGVKYKKPLPLVGNMLPTVTLSKFIAEILQELYSSFPNERFIGALQFTTPVLLIRDPELIKSITIKNFDHFVDHSSFLSADVDPLWGKNLVASKGDRWRDLRQTLSPVFTSSKMRTMFILMDECAKQLTEYFEGQNKEVINIELKDVFSRFTTDVIATTAFGIKCDSFKNKNNDFFLTGKALTQFTGLRRFAFFLYGTYPTLAKFLNFKIIRTQVGNFFRSIIKETIALREEKNIIRPDLIHLLMLSRKGKLKYEEQLNLPETGFAATKESEITKSSNNVNFLSDEDITAQAVVFFFGGFDTTSSTMAFLGYELAVNPDIQKKLKEEIITTSRECNGDITYEKLSNMKYLDMVISEGLRKWPQAIWLDRKCTRDFEIPPEKDGELGLKLKEGDYVWIPLFAIHHDPKYYPNPNVFDPERFSDENKEKIHSGTFIPFGIGPRNCIGSRFALLETKILLYHLLLNFDIVPNEKTSIPLKIKKNSALLTSENGFHVSLRKSKCSG